MTIIPTRDNSNDAVNDTEGDIINNDVIMMIPTSVMVIYDYNSGDDEDCDFKGNN